ncbi:MAG: M48 family metallopeptidase [Deltaproteobacteria bacterium]|nr:M48 family metallopeptidase [Deltaproteobacteria bacterium]
MVRSSLAGRAVFALVMMVVFYAFAAAVVAGLVWVGIKVFGMLGQIRGRGLIALALVGGLCFCAAAVVAWSVLPRWDSFEPPGPEITAAEHPELFVEIRRIAQQTGQREPRHVYLVPEVNAFVAQRGGILGIGSSRVMGIGLPLMRALQVDELRAVLAHEMGHFYGGDTKLGPFIYKTRSGLIRTVVNLTRAQHSVSEAGAYSLIFTVVQAPFRGFLVAYLRLSQAISRAQEISADEVAVRAEGKRALIGGLKKSHAAALAHHLYMNNEVAPLVDAGHLPEVGDGFSRYLKTEAVARLQDSVVEHELAEGEHDPYDSHPPLRDRITAADALDVPDREPDTRPAIELVRDPEAIESADLRKRVDAPLKDIAWADTHEVWEKKWRGAVEHHKHMLRDVALAELDTETRAIYERARAFLSPPLADRASDDDLRAWWQSVVGGAFAVILLDEGFLATAMPGEPFEFRRGDRTVDPFGEVSKRIRGETSEEAWTDRLTELGVADRKLAG